MKRMIPALAVALLATAAAAFAQSGATKYVRYTHDGVVSYGILEGDTIRELKGSIFESAQPTGRTLKLADVKLMIPTDARKVIAVGFNYQSHLGDRKPTAYPGLFAKYPTSLVAHEENIVVPEGSTNLHFEGEMVLVIGRRAKNVSEQDVPNYIFGVTAGNDVSERDWQQADLQWFRAKASDTFGPVGPVVARGVDYNNLLLQTRVNGETKQSERTSDLIFNSAQLVSYISRFVTLEPGDLIFTGTPQQTSAIKPGDVVEIELEGVGVLRNRVAAGPGTSDQQ